MTIDQLWTKLMPTMGPLSARDGALAFAHVADAVRGREDVDEATANRLLAELQARFHRPLS
jgi:hypothetical protein